jgi:hypothetical protein
VLAVEKFERQGPCVADQLEIAEQVAQRESAVAGVDPVDLDGWMRNAYNLPQSITVGNVLRLAVEGFDICRGEVYSTIEGGSR